MIETREIATTRSRLASMRSDGERKRVAFVPTMGALHDGHLALIDVARSHAEIVVASVFVNPLQFGPGEDLAKYPRPIDADVAALRQKGVDLLFLPGVAEMYPPHSVVRVSAEGESVFEGAVRPGHFTGVLTVVAKLFNIVQPDVAIFGQKDLQQLSLIRRMTRDLNIPVEIVAAPTVREADGLAMSSRNRYLSPDDRARATILYRALNAVRERFLQGEREVPALAGEGERILSGDSGVTVDYLSVVEPSDFSVLRVAAPGAAVIVAARVGNTRLIDNIIL